MRLSMTIALCVLLAGCGGTPYQREAFMGGYDEIQLEENVFRVRFKGNGGTRAERAEDFALLRSAEITLEKGFTHFAIVDSRDRLDQSLHSTPSTSYTTGTANVVGDTIYGRAKTKTYGGDSFVISKPSTTNTIVCFKTKPNIQGTTYDAELVKRELRTKYGL